jgi:hypothetical protein
MARRLMPWRRRAERRAFGFTPRVRAISFVVSVASALTISVSSPAVHRRRPSLESGGIGRDGIDAKLLLGEWEKSGSTGVSLTLNWLTAVEKSRFRREVSRNMRHITRNG